MPESAFGGRGGVCVCSRGEGCLLWGVSASGGCLIQGGCLLLGGVCSRGCLLLGVCLLWGCVCLLLGGCICSGGSAQGGLLGGCLLPGGVCSWGVSAPRGCLLWGGVCSRGGGCLLQGGVCSEHALRQTLPPVDRITDACKNITLAKLRCGRYKVDLIIVFQIEPPIYGTMDPSFVNFMAPGIILRFVHPWI